MSSCQVWRNVCAAVASVSPQVACLAVLFLYLGAAVWHAPPDDDGPPSSALVRLTFMLAVALLVVSRQTDHHGTPGFLCEVIMTILVCNMSLSLLWDPLERGVFAVISPLVSLISSVFGVDLGTENLQIAVMSLLAITSLLWVLVSVASVPHIIKKLRRILCLGLYSLRFVNKVEVRKIIPTSHSLLKAPSESIHAPGGGRRNPLVDPPGKPPPPPPPH